MDPNKGHDCKGVSVRMLELSCSSVVKPRLIIFRNYLCFGTIPDDWKKGNVVPVYEKDNKLLMTIALLPICSKIFEKLVCYF